ncbi:MAG: helix-turn-helix domain-containing protein [Nonomuraea sp.]|nr:helix-turn-helix domain-containing protein [Nonomuraea sp.]
MTAEGSPTLRRRKLAAELRRLREDADLNGVQVARALKWSTSKISRMENGQVAPSHDDVTKLVAHYGVANDLARSLLGLVQADGERSWWDAYSDVLSETVLELIGLEAAATTVRTWRAMVIPGLFQTREYAAQITANYQALEFTPPRTVERRTEARMRRQRRLTSAPTLAYEAVIDESALRRRFGDSKLMNEQLRHLVKVSELPNVTVRILTLDQPHPIDIENFVLLSFPAMPVVGALPDTVYSEHHPHFTLTDDSETVYKYALVFDLLTQAALDPDASRDFIASLAGM